MSLRHRRTSAFRVSAAARRSNVLHSFGVSVASLMHVAGLGLVSVRVQAAYLLQSLYMFLLNGANTAQMSFNGKHVFLSRGTSTCERHREEMD